MSVTGLPFDDFRTLIRDLPGHDVAALAAARSRNKQLTKPEGSLGRLGKSRCGWRRGAVALRR